MIGLKSTQDIFTGRGSSFFEKIVVPKEKEFWDYSRDMKIEDVDLWEVIEEIPLHYGVYASYIPYAEFFLFVPGPFFRRKDVISDIETFYGQGAEIRLYKKLLSIGINLQVKKVWIDEDQTWLKQEPDRPKIIVA